MKENDIEEINIPIPTPKALKAFLDKHIVSQEDAKRTISTAIYKHYMRLIQPDTNDGVNIQKSNVLIIGSSGCGKTEIARQISKVLGLPFTIFDVSSVSASGYVGNDLVFCLRDLIDAAHGDLELAQKGVIFIDEFNKIARKSGANNSITQDVGGEKVQGELLRMIEDGIIDVPTERGRINPQQPMIKMDCSNVLFIFSGAFEGLDKIIAKRMVKKRIGFEDSYKKSEIDEDDLMKYVTTEDLLNYGIMRELLSRTPIITHVKPLGTKELRKILTEPQNAIMKQVSKLFAMHGKQIEFTNSALDCIAEEAQKRSTGARALRSIVDKVIDDILYNMDDYKDTAIIKVSKKSVTQSLNI